MAAFYAVVVYRIVTILSGVAFAYFGYRLFLAMPATQEQTGELKATWGDRSLWLRRVGPGLFFALFGATIIGVTASREAKWEQFEVPVQRMKTHEISHPTPEIDREGSYLHWILVNPGPQAPFIPGPSIKTPAEEMRDLLIPQPDYDSVG
jgi:hypothetical protein